MTKHARFAALLLGLAFGALAQTPAGSGGIIVTDIKGTARFRIGDSEPQVVVKGQAIPLGARITTGKDSNVVLTFPDGQIVAMGAKSRLLVREYRYLPNDIDNSRVVMNVTDGSVRIVMGAIGQHDPGLIQLQIGTKTTAQTPNLPRAGDLSLVMLGSATMVQVNQGQVALRVSGESYPLATGEGALVRADGVVQLGGPAQLEKLAGQTTDDKEMFDQFRETQQLTFPHSALQTMITLASPPYDEKKEEQRAGATLLPPLATDSLSTAGTGAVGGGTPCTASCN